MKQAVISTMALAALAASEMTFATRRFDLDEPFTEPRRSRPDQKPFIPFRGNVDLLGKSHGKGTSKRKRQRT